jgi:hypothetical protein
VAIIFADFPSGQIGLYGSTESYMLDGIWAERRESGATAEVILVSDPDANIGSAGRVLKVDGGSTGSSYARIVSPLGAHATVGVGCRLWQNELPEGNSSDGNAQIGFRTSGNVLVCYIQAQTDGSIAAYNSSDVLLGTSALPVLTAGGYHHIETKVLRDAAAGTIEVRVNGVVALDLDTLALGASNIGIVTLGCDVRNSGSTVPGNHYKDFVYWDGSGSAGNDFQGSVAVRDLYTDADIDIGDWTASTGSTIWDLVDETTPDDADYGQAADPAPDPVKMSLTDLPDDVTSVKALIPITRAIKTDGGDCSLQVGLTPNDVDWDDGADNPLTTAYTYRWDVSHTSPDTAAAWTPTEVNAAYVRLDRTL